MIIVMIRELDRPDSLRSIPFRESLRKIRIGRDLENDVVLASRSVSKNHAVVKVSRQTISIDDAGSTNGTYVNGHQVAADRSQPLRLGDRIGIGSFILQLVPSSADRETTKRMTPGETSALVQQLEPSSLAEIRVPTSHSLRQLMAALLVGDSDLDGFCLDYFPKVKRRFTMGMDRVAKENVLLEYVNRYVVLTKLRDAFPRELSAQSRLLQYESNASPE